MDRKNQRLFLEWSLKQPGMAGITKGRIQWLRERLNGLLLLPNGQNDLKKRMQAVYYILACCRKAGISHTELEREEAQTPDGELHAWLEAQEPEYFDHDFLESECELCLPLHDGTSTYIKVCSSHLRDQPRPERAYGAKS